jgi:hypothetical protein
MFYTVLHASHACFTLWKKMSRSSTDWIQLHETLVDEMDIPPSQFQWVRNLSLIFLNQSSRCQKCQLEGTFDNVPMEAMEGPFLKGRTIWSPSKIRTLPLPHPLPVAEPDQPSSPSAETFHEEIDFGGFDEYSTAPIWIGNDPPLFDVWTFNSPGFQALPSFAYTWKDRGYRLPPDFAKVSQKENPTDFVSRLLPTMHDTTQQNTGPNASPPSSISSDDETLDVSRMT